MGTNINLLALEIEKSRLMKLIKISVSLMSDLLFLENENEIHEQIQIYLLFIFVKIIVIFANIALLRRYFSLFLKETFLK